MSHPTRASQPLVRDVLPLLRKPLASLGLVNAATSAVRALRAGGGRRKEIRRHLLLELFRGLGNRRAVVTRDGVVTFAELADRVVRLASGLHDLGLRPGDRVGALLRNEQAWFDTMLACMVTGLKMPLLNTHLRPHELVSCVNASQPKALIFSREQLDLVRSVRAALTSVETFVCTGEGDLPPGFLTLDALLARGRPTLPPGGFGVPHMPFSGGSTGVPKFIVHDDRGATAAARRKGLSRGDLAHLGREALRGVARLGIWSIERDVVALVPGPLYHAGPQIAVMTLFFGSTVVPMAKFDAEGFLALVERERVNYTFVAPTMLERILALPEETRRKYDLSSMRVVLCAAAPCPEHVKRETNALFLRQGAPCNVFHEYYGSSEATLISVLRPADYEADENRYRSVGRPAGSECRVYDPERGRWCAPGEVGHVLVRNVRMYGAKYGNSDEMDSAFREIDGVLWYDDGCLGHLAEDGFLYLTSRSKDMIISGGVNVFPAEIEEVLKSHPSVVDAAVVRIPDDDLGEAPGALVELSHGASLDAAALLTYCRERGLYGFKMPKVVEFTDHVPRTPAGKIRKAELEAHFAARLPRT